MWLYKLSVACKLQQATGHEINFYHKYTSRIFTLCVWERYSPKPPAGGKRWAASPASSIRLSQDTNFSATSACITHGFISITSMSTSSWPTNLKINFSHTYKELNPSKEPLLTMENISLFILLLATPPKRLACLSLIGQQIVYYCDWLLLILSTWLWCLSYML